MKTDRFFRLYSHAIAVAGKERAAVYDLHKGNIVAIPRALCPILEELNTLPVAVVKQKYVPQNPQVLDTYLTFLREKGVGFYTHLPMCFPPIDLTWASPCHIQTAVIDYQFAHYSLTDVLRQLDSLLCRSLELRFQINADTIDTFVQCIQALNEKTFRSVDIVVNYCPELLENNRLETVYHSCPKINRILIDQSPWTQKPEPNAIPIAFVETNVRHIRPQKRHVVHVHYFTEAQNHNPYYNRKVCIDATGAIKNCLLLEQTFGNVQYHSLKTVIHQPDFQELWFASPDKIEDIRHSELRYALFLPEALEKDMDSGLYRIQQSIATPVLANEVTA